MKSYTTLLFDSDDTLLDFKAAEAGALREALEFFGLEFNSHSHNLYSTINQEFWQGHERGEIKRSEISVGRFRKFLETIGNSDISPEELAPKYEERLACHHPLIDGAWELLEKLKGKYNLYIVTNGMQKVQEKRLNESRLETFFDGIFISQVLGAPKPEKEFFDIVLGKVRETDKSRILIIGDSLTSDIKGGINAGIDTCWLNRDGKTTDIKPTYEVKNFKELEKMLV